MRIVVPHGSTQARAMEIVDQSSAGLFDFGVKSVTLGDQKKSWNGPVMDFSMVANAGFISLPLAGTVMVDETNVTVDCELPALVKNFIGEDRLRSDIGQHLSQLLAH